MNLQFIRWIDKYLGIPICIFLSALNSVSSILSERKQKKPSKILFIELSEMGSAILAVPSIQKARQLYPEAELNFLIFERHKETVEILGIIPPENIFTIKDSSFKEFVTSSIETLKKIRAAKIDTTLDLELFSRFTAIYAFLSGASNRVGFHKYLEEGLYRGNFLTHKVFYNCVEHISVNFLKLVIATTEDQNSLPSVKQKISVSKSSFEPVNLSREQNKQTSELLKELYPKLKKSSKLVLFAPDPGALELRGWPQENYIELGKILLDNYDDLFIGIVGISSFHQAGETIKGQLGQRAQNLCGLTPDLKSLLSLFSEADLLILSDSGPGHIAPLVNLNSIVLFGPESKTRYSPLGKTTSSLSAGLSCSPCFSATNHRNSVCSNNICMQAISTKAVYTKAQKYLDA